MHIVRNYQSPFGYRAKSLLNEMNLPDEQVCECKISPTPPWKMPEIKFCRYFKGIKANMLDDEIKNSFLEHAVEHNDSSFIFTDGSKSESGVGFGIFNS